MSLVDLLKPIVVEDWERIEDKSYRLYRHRQQPQYTLGFSPKRSTVSVVRGYQGTLKDVGEFFGEPSIMGLAQALQPPPPTTFQQAADLLRLLAWKHGVAATPLSWNRWYAKVFDPEKRLPLFDLPDGLYQILLELVAPYRRINGSDELMVLSESVREIAFDLPSSQHEALEIFQRLEHHPLHVFLEKA